MNPLRYWTDIFWPKTPLSSTPDYQSRDLLLALEPRLLLDAAGAATAIDASDNEPAPVEEAPPPDNQEQAITTDPARFEANVGQADAQALYLSRGENYNLFLTDSEILLSLWQQNQDSGEVHNDILSLSLSGSNPDAGPTGDNALEAVSNYYLGTEDQWLEDIANYQQIRYDDIYNGIDMLFYGNQNNNFEYDFVVEAGANANQIAMQFSGQDSLSITESGNLMISIGEQELQQQAPIAYQLANDGSKLNVTAAFVIGSNNTVSFELGAYNPNQTLWIDPILSYSTYFGGSSQESANAVSVDNSGNVYITGTTSSDDFPTINAYDTSYSSSDDVFVTKFDSSHTLLYSTYLGGTGTDIAYSIASDSAGNAYITGETDNDTFPTTAGAYQTSINGNTEAFYSKLDNTGALIYSSFFGGGSDDIAHAITLGSDNRIYLSGITSSNDLPVLNGVFNSSQGSDDAFLSVFNSDGSLYYSTYFGGSDVDDARAIVLDSSNNAYISGLTLSSDLTVLNPYQASKNGAEDAFIARFDPSLSGVASLLYSSYFGGGDNDFANGIAIDSSGSIYIAGETSSSDLDTLNSIQNSYSGGRDAFISKFNNSGDSLIYSTYLGGSSADFAYSIVVDNSNIAFVVGTTDDPTTKGFPSTDVFGPVDKRDAFLAALNPAGDTLLYNAVLGSSQDDFGNGVALNGNGSAYLIGTSRASDFPVTGDAYQSVRAGADETFISKITHISVPGVPDPVLTEDTDSGAIIITRNDGSGAELSHYKITAISGGSLFSDAAFTQAINNNNFISSAGISTAIYFRPAADSNADGSFTVQAATSNNDGALFGISATSTISITPVGDTPLVANSITDEDSQSGAIVIDRNANDGAEVSHFRISGISNGSLFQNDGSTAIFNGDFISFAEGQAGLKFTPTANSNTSGSFSVESSEDGATVAAQSGTDISTISINPIGDTPQVASISAAEAVQSGAIVISRNSNDGAEVTHFKITAISNGSLFKNDGITVINNGDYITFAEGQAGVKFTSFSAANGSFAVQSSEDGTTVAAQSTVAATSTIIVNPVISTLEDTATSEISVIDPTFTSTHFKFTDIIGGSLFDDAALTIAINNNDFINTVLSIVTVYFLPDPDSTSSASFTAQPATNNNDSGLFSVPVVGNISITPVGDTPQVSSISSNEDTQSTGIVIDRNAADGTEVSHFRISTISNGSLFKNDGTTAINNGDYITFAEGQAGVKFTPAANSNTDGSFSVQSSEDGTTIAAQSGIATSTISINSIGDIPQVANINTDEDTQSTGIVIDRNASDGIEVSHFRISAISNGSLFKNDGTTAIINGDYITFAEGQAGVKFTPAANSNSAGSFSVQSSEDGSTVAAQSGTATSTISINPIGDTPLVANISTTEDTQSAGIVIDRNAADGAEVSHFKITGISNGTLFKNNGTTAINNGDYITFVEGQARVKFTPTANSNTNGSFVVESSEDGTTVAAQSGTATSTITITPIGDTPQVANISTDEDTRSAGIIIDRNSNDGAEVTHFKITAINNGTLSKNDGTFINNGDYITFAEGQAGVKFTPATNSNTAGSFVVQSSEDGSTVAAQSGLATADITVKAVGDTPQVTDISTLEATQSGAIIISRNNNDGTEVTHFKITAISNGTLFKSDGSTVINDGDFISFAEGQGGVKFTPSSTANGSFAVQSSEDGSTVAAQSAVAAKSIITVTRSSPDASGIVPVTPVLIEPEAILPTSSTESVTESAPITEETELPDPDDTVDTEAIPEADFASPATGFTGQTNNALISPAVITLDGEQSLDLSVLINQMNTSDISVAEQQDIFKSIGAKGLIEGYKNSDNPLSQNLGNVLENLYSGQNITHGDFLKTIGENNLNNNSIRSNLIAFSTVLKDARTNLYSSAINQLDNTISDGMFDLQESSDQQTFTLPPLEYKNIAILIGVDQYEAPIPDLATPLVDVNSIARVLGDNDYQSIVLANPKYLELIQLFNEIKRQITADQNLLIYFAGHGYLNEDNGVGYWLVNDSTADNPGKWISTAHLAEFLNQVKANQIIMVADSCFSGTLTREYQFTSDSVGLSPADILTKRSVMVMSSGGEEPVMDGGGDGHSAFARNFMQTLQQSRSTQSGFELFTDIRQNVTQISPQTPEYGAILSAGHEKGGDYLFHFKQ